MRHKKKKTVSVSRMERKLAENDKGSVLLAECCERWKVRGV